MRSYQKAKLHTDSSLQALRRAFATSQMVFGQVRPSDQHRGAVLYHTDMVFRVLAAGDSGDGGVYELEFDYVCWGAHRGGYVLRYLGQQGVHGARCASQT